MPLNVNAKEWEPKDLSEQLMNMRINSAKSIKTKSSNEIAIASRPPLSTGELAGTSPATSSGDTCNASIEDELQFEEIFDHQVCFSADASSQHTTPRNSLVGPSPFPSPLQSPQTYIPILSVTETSAYLSTSASSNTYTKDPRSTFAASPAKASSLLSRDHHQHALDNEDLIDDHHQYQQYASPPCQQTLDSNREPLEREQTPTVITHVETEVSAAASNGSNRRLGPDDFELLKIVGQGAFGKVFQVRKRDTNEVFAMKVMRKDRIIEKKHGEYVKAERDVLTSIVHPFIVTLRYSFQTSTKLYLVLDFINGGHLFFQLYRAGTFDESLAQLYTAEMVLALTHLHSLGFVHRDLKPENVLLDNEGHVRVTDFGLAKGNMSDADDARSNSFIGTMEYMAPEVVIGRGHGKAVDWWSIGVLLYEMLCGVPPFRAKSRNALQKMITTGKLKLPAYLSTEASNLLKGLLQKEASKRLGFGPDGSSHVMGHAFFKGIDWDKLQRRQVVSPFRPTVRSHDSVENFDKIWTDLPAKDSPCVTPTKSRSLGADERNAFEGFTYCAPSFMAHAASMNVSTSPSLQHHQQISNLNKITE